MMTGRPDQDQGLKVWLMDQLNLVNKEVLMRRGEGRML